MSAKTPGNSRHRCNDDYFVFRYFERSLRAWNAVQKNAEIKISLTYTCDYPPILCNILYWKINQLTIN